MMRPRDQPGQGQDQSQITQDSPYEDANDANGIMAEMGLLMAPIPPPGIVGSAGIGAGAGETSDARQMKEKEQDEVQRRIKQSKNEAITMNQAKVLSEAAIQMAKSDLRGVMRRRGLSVSKNKKTDVQSLINSYYVEAKNKIVSDDQTI